MADIGNALLTGDGDDYLIDEYGNVLLWGDPEVPVLPVGPVTRRPVNPSRLRNGLLLFGAGGDGGYAYDFSCTQTAVKLAPSFSTVGTDVTTICGRKITATRRTSWELQGDALSDFGDPDGFIRFAWQNAGVSMAFRWLPAPLTAAWEGLVTVRPIEIGGSVGKRLTASWAWPIQGAPVRVLDPIVVGGG